MDFQQISDARNTLGLGEHATLKEIKNAYKRLALKYHPDRAGCNNKKEHEEMFKKIANAYDTIVSYCAGYTYSFKEKDVRRNSMDKETYEHLKRFYDGWLGNLGL